MVGHQIDRASQNIIGPAAHQRCHAAPPARMEDTVPGDPIAARIQAAIVRRDILLAAAAAATPTASWSHCADPLLMPLLAFTNAAVVWGDSLAAAAATVGTFSITAQIKDHLGPVDELWLDATVTRALITASATEPGLNGEAGEAGSALRALQSAAREYCSAAAQLRAACCRGGSVAAPDETGAVSSVAPSAQWAALRDVALKSHQAAGCETCQLSRCPAFAFGGVGAFPGSQHCEDALMQLLACADGSPSGPERPPVVPSCATPFPCSFPSNTAADFLFPTVSPEPFPADLPHPHDTLPADPAEATAAPKPPPPSAHTCLVMFSIHKACVVEVLTSCGHALPDADAAWSLFLRQHTASGFGYDWGPALLALASCVSPSAAALLHELRKDMVLAVLEHGSAPRLGEACTALLRSLAEQQLKDNMSAIVLASLPPARRDDFALLDFSVATVVSEAVWLSSAPTSSQPESPPDAAPSPFTQRTAVHARCIGRATLCRLRDGVPDGQVAAAYHVILRATGTRVFVRDDSGTPFFGQPWRGASEPPGEPADAVTPAHIPIFLCTDTFVGLAAELCLADSIRTAIRQFNDLMMCAPFPCPLCLCPCPCSFPTIVCACGNAACSFYPDAFLLLCC